MREAAEFAALFTPFTLAGKRLRNRITHVSMKPTRDTGGPRYGASDPVSRQSRRGWRRHDGDRAARDDAPSGEYRPGAATMRTV